MAFHFKQFSVDDTGCGMPVNTDSVLLGAWANVENAQTILDIGAGSGILSLMAAQRSNAEITAVELDNSATKTCLNNFKNSPWAERLHLYQSAIQTFSAAHSFDCILCNPPYFDNGPQATKTNRATARHTDQLSFIELCQAIKKHLSLNGVASLIIPATAKDQFNHALTQTNLAIHTQVNVSSIKDKPTSRHLLQITHLNTTLQPIEISNLFIREKDNSYSKRMQQLTGNFYLNIPSPS